MTASGEAVSEVSGGRRPVWWWARRRSMVLDVVLAAASAAECAAQGVPFARDAGLPLGFGIVLGLVAGSTLVLRRRWPIVPVLVGMAVTPAEMGFLLAVVGLYTLAASDIPRRITAALAGMSVSAVIIVTFVQMYQTFEEHDRDSPFVLAALVALLMSVGLTLPPLLFGLYVGARRRLVESLRERADGLERELSLLAERAEERAVWARREERTRIARDMHDVVAHRVSLMVVHAAALERVVLNDPEKAARNAALVGDMGRQALTELREMLGVLRMPAGSVSAPGSGAPGGGEAVVGAAAPGGAASGAAASGGTAAEAAGAGFGVAVAGAGAGAGSRAGADGAGVARGGPEAASSAGGGASAAVATDAGRPARGGPAAAARAGQRPRDAADADAGGPGPRLDDLEALIGESRAAGMAVDFAEEGDPGPYAAEVEQTVYRVVQEALTNVHKHAPGAKTRVLLAHRVAEVAVLVVNGPSDAASQSAGLPSGGNGLVGMRERVTGLGGGFVSAATDAGGFRVSAVLPAGA
ncbi:sensor histidine kinase [Streptomyces sp. WAC 06738]|uniref:sensor histidine kinase n=1 Tax=Streptomyces sp. WAC 06738 TaxID=2203210 RepID=UPI000F6EE329|nr:sensor histidine kinase [Streptomyces sp. WAC 06738]AZM46451.1 sensor histidine kinase [Streptomyces sp. WAC 06738]